MKELKDFPGYFITEDGKVFSAWKKQFIGGKGCKSYIDYDDLKELKERYNHKGYLCVVLKKDNKKQTKTRHRLVAETYIPNPNNLPQINHIDENKVNNHFSNLEWVTNHQNAVYSKCRWIYQIQNIITGEIVETINVNEFSRKNNLSPRNLHLTLTGKLNQHKNFKILSKTQFK
jgi:hypothetical protein